MRKAEYRITIKAHNNKAEVILNEIDQFFITLEQKHPQLKVST